MTNLIKYKRSQAAEIYQPISTNPGIPAMCCCVYCWDIFNFNNTDSPAGAQQMSWEREKAPKSSKMNKPKTVAQAAQLAINNVVNSQTMNLRTPL